ncbi:MAG: hypothetical protein JW900_04900 [Anaerolineae bacterium]|nr:hypothetical protein [Anaerolineae bacterium]
MTRRLAVTEDEDQKPRQFDAEWAQLLEQGEAPEVAGRTAAEAQRSARRVAAGGRRLMPSELRRRERRVGGRLPVALVQDLRRICQEWDGENRISSYVLERMIGTVIGLYRAGRLELVQETVPTAGRGSRTPANGGTPAEQAPAVAGSRMPKQAICATLRRETVAELRRISQELGHTTGPTTIAAAVLELLLSTAVSLYDQGLLYLTEEEATTVRHRLVWKPRPAEEIA